MAMSDEELRERAHALANVVGTCLTPDYRRVFRHSDGCNAVFDALRAAEAEAAQLRQRVEAAEVKVVEIDEENGSLKAKLVEARQRVSDLERERGRLRSFAENVRDEHDCGEECEDDEGNGIDAGECPCGGDECWRCAAEQAIRPPSWAAPPALREGRAGGTDVPSEERGE